MGKFEEQFDGSRFLMLIYRQDIWYIIFLQKNQFSLADICRMSKAVSMI